MPLILSVDSFYLTSLDSVLIRSALIRLVGSLGNCRELLAQSSKVIKAGVLLSLANERFDLEYVLGTSCRESFTLRAGKATGGGVGCGIGSALPSRYLIMASFSAMALVRWQTLLFSNSCFISERFRQRWNCQVARRSWQFSPCRAMIACCFYSNSRSHSSLRMYFSEQSLAVACRLASTSCMECPNRSRYCSSCWSTGCGSARATGVAGMQRDCFKFMVTDQLCYKLAQQHSIHPKTPANGKMTQDQQRTDILGRMVRCLVVFSGGD